jgi:hypothetical protein
MACFFHLFVAVHGGLANGHVQEGEQRLDTRRLELVRRVRLPDHLACMIDELKDEGEDVFTRVESVVLRKDVFGGRDIFNEMAGGSNAEEEHTKVFDEVDALVGIKGRGTIGYKVHVVKGDEVHSDAHIVHLGRLSGGGKGQHGCKLVTEGFKGIAQTNVFLVGNGHKKNARWRQLVNSRNLHMRILATIHMRKHPKTLLLRSHKQGSVLTNQRGLVGKQIRTHDNTHLFWLGVGLWRKKKGLAAFYFFYFALCFMFFFLGGPFLVKHGREFLFLCTNSMGAIFFFFFFFFFAPETKSSFEKHKPLGRTKQSHQRVIF